MRKQQFKQIKNLFLVFATFAIISCGKDGTMGPEGQKGVQGEQGVKGNDGSTVHSGSGTPISTLGQPGDFYLDKATTNLYGPKNTAGWGEPLSLRGAKGENGANGAAGSKILSGKGNPAATLGSNDDFYFDTEQVAFYGPKSASSWGTPISLKAANDNGVKVVTIKNFKAEGVRVAEYNSSFSVETIIKPTVDYDRYYNEGIIFVQVKDPNDQKGIWSESVSRGTTLDAGLLAESYVGTEGLPFGKDGFYLETNFHFWTTDWTDMETLDLEQYHNKLLDEFAFDIKIVLIPGTQVNAMKSQNINVKDRSAVAKYLRL